MRKNKKAFTLAEICIVVILVTLVLGVVYKIFSGVISQLFKSSTKMTNLRAASLILERLKNDVRCAVIPADDSEKPEIEDGKFSFLTTSDLTVSDERGKRRRVTYTLDGNILNRKLEGVSDRKISSAKVRSFKVEPDKDDEKERKYITILIVVDNEMESSSNRSANSLNNQVELKAVLYPRFFEQSLSDEEQSWYKYKSRN